MRPWEGRGTRSRNAALARFTARLLGAPVHTALAPQPARARGDRVQSSEQGTALVESEASTLGGPRMVAGSAPRATARDAAAEAPKWTPLSSDLGSPPPGAHPRPTLCRRPPPSRATPPTRQNGLRLQQRMLLQKYLLNTSALKIKAPIHFRAWLTCWKGPRVLSPQDTRVNCPQETA